MSRRAFRNRAGKDVGKHYRYKARQRLTAEDKVRRFVDVNVDPYRVCKVYEVGGGPREHMIKKGLRGGGKGHSERELVVELCNCLDRWEEMLDEDGE